MVKRYAQRPTQRLASLLMVSSMVAMSFATFAGVAGAAPSKTVTRTVTRSKVSRPVWLAKVNVPMRSWVPVERPKEVLLCVHGLGFSSLSFTDFGQDMAGRGYAVYAMDVRGFGQWMKRKEGDTVDFEACLNDVEASLKKLRAAYPGVPVFLVGESMGGAIALAATSRYPALVDGLVSAVPSSDRFGKVRGEVVVGAHYLEDRDREIDISPTVVARSTSDKTMQRQMKANPTNRMKISPRELKAFEDFMKGNNDAAALIEKQPVLMMAGFKDKLVKPEGTIELFNALTTQDKLLMVVGDGEHLLLEENQMTSQMAQLLDDWIRTEGASLRRR